MTSHEIAFYAVTEGMPHEIDSIAGMIEKRKEIALKAERKRIMNAIKENCSFENKGDLENFIIDLMKD